MIDENRIYKYLEGKIASLPEHYQDYFYSLEPEDQKKRTTIKSYLSRMAKVEILLGKRLLVKEGNKYIAITEEEALEFKKMLKNTLKLGISSINAYLAFMKSIYSYWANESKIIDKSPIPPRYRYAQGSDRKDLYVTEDHVKIIKKYLKEIVELRLSAVPKSFDVSYIYFQAMQRQAIVRLLMDTGVRISEVVRIKITDFKEVEIVINNKKIKQWHIGINSSKKQDGGFFLRWAAIHKDTKKCIDDMIFVSPNRIKDGTAPLSSSIKGVSSVSSQRKIFNEANRSEAVRSWVKDIKDELNKRGFDIPELTTHSFRYLLATRLKLEGTDINDISIILGHSSPTVTYKYIARTHQETGAAMHKAFGF